MLSGPELLNKQPPDELLPPILDLQPRLAEWVCINPLSISVSIVMRLLSAWKDFLHTLML